MMSMSTSANGSVVDPPPPSGVVRKDFGLARGRVQFGFKGEAF